MALSNSPTMKQAVLAGLMSLIAACAQQPEAPENSSYRPRCVDECHDIDSFDAPSPCGGECHEMADTGEDTGLEDDRHQVHDNVHACTMCHTM